MEGQHDERHAQHDPAKRSAESHDETHANAPAQGAGRKSAAAQIHRSLGAWHDRQQEAEPEEAHQDDAHDHDEAHDAKPGAKKEQSNTSRVMAKLASLSRKVHRAPGPGQEYPAIEFAGRTIAVINGVACYQSSGQANQLGGIQKPVGAWYKIWGVQEVADPPITAGWIIKQTLQNPNPVALPPLLPNAQLKMEGSKGSAADVNAWLRSKGYAAVNAIRLAR